MTRRACRGTDAVLRYPVANVCDGKAARVMGTSPGRRPIAPKPRPRPCDAALPVFALWLAFSVGACGEPEYATGAGPADTTPLACDDHDLPAAVADELALDTSFYAQACSAFGVPVLGSVRLSGTTLALATELVSGVLAPLAPNVRDAIHDRYLRVVIVAASAGETFSDVPELADLREAERAAAGIGPDPMFPAATVRDSVVLCRPVHREPAVTPPGDTLVHELGHAVLSMGLEPTQPDFRRRLSHAFTQAAGLARWQTELSPEVRQRFGSRLETPYLMTNADEYWAVGVSVWFGFVGVPIRYELTDAREETLRITWLYGRSQLRQRDPPLAALLEEVFGEEPTLAHHCSGWFPQNP
ncbi:MAG: hypothetical protein OXU20_42555 [Myxococcales bacterium]|nr:hypothetical protein [Myxococcales bacterium]